MPYRIVLAPNVEKEMMALPEPLRSRVSKQVDDLSLNARPVGAVKMKGLRDTWRVRVGDWRIVYEIHDTVLIVLVVRVGHRREVYRRLG